MPQRFFPTDSDVKEAVFGAVQRYDGQYTVTAGVGGTMISFAVDRETLISMRDLIDEELAVQPEPKPEYLTKDDMAQIKAHMIRLAKKLGMSHVDICQTLYTSSQQVTDALSGHHMRQRPKNPPGRD